MLLTVATVPSDPGNFYATSAGILTAVIIAGMLEIRYVVRTYGADLGHFRWMLAAFIVILAVSAIALAQIPTALLYGPGLFSRTAIANLVFATILAGLFLGIGVTLGSIFHDHVNSDSSTGQEVTRQVTNDPPIRGAAWLIVVLVALSARRHDRASGQ